MHRDFRSPGQKLSQDSGHLGLYKLKILQELSRRVDEMQSSLDLDPDLSSHVTNQV